MLCPPEESRQRGGLRDHDGPQEPALLHVEGAVSGVHSRPWTAYPVGLHVVVVALLSAGYALVRFSAEDPNIGAGVLLLPLFVLGLPWSVLLLLDTHLDSDVTLVAASVLNVVLHLLVAAYVSRRRPQEVGAIPASRPVAAALVVVVALVSAGAVLRTAARSADSQGALRAELMALLPADVWEIGRAHV